MSHQSKWEYLRAIYERYRKASQALKHQILDEFCANTGYHRKYAICLLNGPPPEGKPKRRLRRRNQTYGSRAISILEAIWEAAGYPWSARLKALLPLWLPWAKKHFLIPPEVEQQLMTISPSTMDRRLKAKKARLKRRLYGRTKPGTLLKHQIPIKTDHWDVTGPGFTEVDLVSHSGPSAEGEFIHSLNLTDIHTTWVETRAVLGKGQVGVREAFEDMGTVLPFVLRGIDSDNGSEFINDHLYRYCQDQQIQFTRGRPYKKDDNAHVEQKNWTHVRKLLGWERYDTDEALKAINDLYRNELRLMMNLFQPSVKLLQKVRVGSRLKKVYDKPQTPLERLMASQQGDPARVAELIRLRDRLDPFELSKVIDRKLERIYHLAHQRTAPSLARTIPNKPTQEPLTRIERESLRAISEAFGIPIHVRHRTKQGKISDDKTITPLGKVFK